MNIQAIDLVVLSLAVWQAVEVWHHSTLFADWRARLECWPSWEEQRWSVLFGACRGLGGDKTHRKWYCRHLRREILAREFARDVLLCPWCLSVWAGFVLGAAWFFLPAWLSWLNLFAVGLAASRAANLGNDCLRRYARTPGRSSLPGESDTPKEDDF